MSFEKEFKITVDGKEETLLLRPLTGKHIGKFFKILKTFKSIKKSETESAEDFGERVLDVFSEESITVTHELVKVTLADAYPGRWSEDDLERFTTVNLLTLLGPLIELNLPASG